MILSNYKWVFGALVSITIISACNNEPKTKNVVVEEPLEQRVENEHLLLSDELNNMLEKQIEFNLIDCRKAEQFIESHLPNAINIYRDEVCLDDTLIGGLAVSKETLENVLSKKGVKPNLEIVLYDDRAQCEATRLWWLLKRFGFEQVRILDGGFQEWTAIGLTLVNDSGHALSFSPSNFKFLNEENASILASKNDVLKAVNHQAAKLIDCRSYEEFSGETQKSGAHRAGHIPGAVHFDFWNNLNIGSDGEIWFLENEILEAKYAELGLLKNEPIIVYCQSGVRSAQTLFVLTELLGYRNVKNYDGSWIEWSADENLPIEASTNTSIH